MAENRKRRSRSRSWRRKLERKAGQSALLFLLLNKPGFRYTVLGIIFAFLCAGFYMAPLWNVAPEGYEPKVKMSLYAIKEVEELKAKAETAMVEKDWGEAAYLLRVAMMKNSVEPVFYRMMITNRLNQEILEPSEIREVTLRTEKLLALTKNEPADLDLVLSFLDQQGLHEHAIYTLLANESLTQFQAMRLLELLFEAERYESFTQVKKQYANQLQEHSQTLSAYEHAVNVLTADSFDLSNNQLSELKQLSERRDKIGKLSRRLLLQVFRHFDQAKEYESVFKMVKKNKEDLPTQHASYWELLIVAKQPQKAVYEAAQYWPFLVHHRFNRLNEVVHIAHAYQEVGLSKRSFELLDQIQTRFEDELAYWVGYGDLLLRSEKWLEATALAVSLRSQRAGIKLVKPYAYYLEGISQGKLNRRPSASTAFSELIKLSPLDDENTVLNMASGMVEVGLGSEAMEFLQVHDASLEDRLAYYKLLYQAAKEAGNSIALVEADQALIELNPSLPDTDVRRLETAILALDDTETVLESFLAARAEDAINDGQRLLVACAYMQQQKPQEAKQWLESINKSELGLNKSAMYAFVEFEWLVRTSQIEDAQKQLVLINREGLFPSHLTRLEALELQITTPNP